MTSLYDMLVDILPYYKQYQVMFSLICAWINGWVSNYEAGDLRRHCAHYDVTVMNACRWWTKMIFWTRYIRCCDCSLRVPAAIDCISFRIIGLERIAWMGTHNTLYPIIRCCDCLPPGSLHVTGRLSVLQSDRQGKYIRLLFKFKFKITLFHIIQNHMRYITRLKPCWVYWSR